jgi:hypothetical protein
VTSSKDRFMPLPQILIPAAALLIAGSTVALGQAQPATETPAQPAAQPTDQMREDDRELLKARLQRRLEDYRSMEERLERALKMLDEGQPTDRVREEAFPVRRGGPEGREGPRPDSRPELRLERPDGPPHGDQPIDREAMLRFLDRHNTELAQRLRSAVQDNPEMVDRTLRRFEPHFREVMAERDDQMRELRIENLRIGWDLMSASREFGQSLRADPASEQTLQARQRVRAVLGRHFEVQVKLHEREIHLLESRIARLRAEIQEQSSDPEAYIQNKLTQIESMVQRYGERSRGQGPDGQRDRPSDSPRESPGESKDGDPPPRRQR